MEEIETYIKNNLKHCVEWKGDDSEYEEWLLEDVTKDILSLIKERDGKVIKKLEGLKKEEAIGISGRLDYYNDALDDAISAIKEEDK